MNKTFNRINAKLAPYKSFILIFSTTPVGLLVYFFEVIMPLFKRCS